MTSADYANGVLTLFHGHRVETRLNIAGDYTIEQFEIRDEDGDTPITVRPPGGDVWRG